MAYYRELATLVPANQGPLIRSPTGSWLASTASVAQPAFSVSSPSSQVNGTKARSPTREGGRPARQDKKRRSLAFFRGGSTSEAPSDVKPEKPAADPQQSDAASTNASSRSRSKDNSKSQNRISLSFLGPTSPTPEALPHFPSQHSSQQSLNMQHRRSQSTERRPATGKSGKSGKSEKSEHHRKGSVRKRLSILNIGKKSSKTNVKGRVGDTLTEE